MTVSHLSDLDALLLSVRDNRSRTYVAEAVTAYRAGAYRAAILSTWVAITFDLIAKIRELAADGDNHAVAYAEDLDRNIAANNKTHLLKIEDKLLAAVESRFSFISPLERVQLERLREDRHTCVHPALTDIGHLYSPPAELVRLHIVNCVNIVLSQPPVQGRGALASFEKDIELESFPREREPAIRWLVDRYMRRGKASLVRNIGVVCTKTLLSDTTGSLTLRNRLLFTLDAIARERSDIHVDVLTTALTLMERMDDLRVVNSLHLLSARPQLWPRLKPAAKEQIIFYLKSVIDLTSSAVASAISLADSIDELRLLILKRYSQLEDHDKAEIISTSPRNWMRSDALRILREASSSRAAERRFRMAVLPLSELGDAEFARAVLDVVRSNYEVYDAGEVRACYHPLHKRCPVSRWRRPGGWSFFPG